MISKSKVDGSIIGKKEGPVEIRRIYIGPYATKGEAEKALEKVMMVFGPKDKRSRPFIIQR